MNKNNDYVIANDKNECDIFKNKNYFEDDKEKCDLIKFILINKNLTTDEIKKILTNHGYLVND